MAFRTSAIAIVAAICLATLHATPALAINCKVPAIENGRRQQITVSHPGHAQYSCSLGFMLVGEARPGCNAQGQLSTVPSCQKSCVESANCPQGLVCRAGSQEMCAWPLNLRDQYNINRRTVYLHTSDRGWYSHAMAGAICRSMGLSLPTETLGTRIQMFLRANFRRAYKTVWTRQVVGNEAIYLSSVSARMLRRGKRSMSVHQRNFFNSLLKLKTAVTTGLSGLVCEEASKALTCSGYNLVISHEKVTRDTAVSTCRQYGMNLLRQKWAQRLHSNECFQEATAHFPREHVRTIWIWRKKTNKFLEYTTLTNSVRTPQKTSNAYICASKDNQ
ncbi:uncharacterized protein LOC135818780 [Sycon ciliatum]|uniref:uncharacterized protein LOC135818780 n=1 Tax=Sycon ciliatum TaxID=27933 RepID=UPI0031F612CF